MRSKQVLQYVLAVTALAVLSHRGSPVRSVLAYVQQNTSPVAALRDRPGGPAAVRVSAVARDCPGGHPGILADRASPRVDLLGLGLGNTLEALLGAYLLRRFIDFRPDLSRIRDVVGLALARCQHVGQRDHWIGDDLFPRQRRGRPVQHALVHLVDREPAGGSWWSPHSCWSCAPTSPFTGRDGVISKPPSFMRCWPWSPGMSSKISQEMARCTRR